MNAIMTHLDAPHLVDWLGLTVGAVGLCIGIYFRMVSIRDVPLKVSLLYFGVGSAFLLLHAEPVLPNRLIANSWRVVAITGVLIAEIVGVMYVVRTTEATTKLGRKVDRLNECVWSKVIQPIADFIG